FGKYLLVLFQQFGIFSKAVHWKEKRGRKPAYFPKALPAALATLALNQLKKLDRLNLHRKEIALLYAKALRLPEREGIFLRFPVLHPNAHEIIRKFWKQNILIGDWYTSPIAPSDTLEESVGYQKGSCPVAERLSSMTLNLPTHIRISRKNAENIISLLNHYGS
ncbi:MAG: DegT/DnrJ/EryC1/StrS family aminotransferase, partial [bacterium]|nr:DegT/DnrJ/EryC1/StrS family aminotransferase [bacterium]